MSSALRIYLAAWLFITVVASVAIHARTRIDLAPMPDREASRWAYEMLNATRRGQPLPPAPASATRFAARGPVFVTAYLRGKQRARHVGNANFAAAVGAAAKAFSADPSLRFPDKTTEPWRFRFGITRGKAPLFDVIPYVRLLALVPLRDGLSATLDGKTEYITPDEILSLGLYDRAISPPIPDLSLGTNIDALSSRLARALGSTPEQLRARGHVDRVRIDSLPPMAAGDNTRVTRATLQRGAAESARFIMRHQARSGRFSYLYDAQTGRASDRGGYSFPRHAGSTFFLAQAAHQLPLEAARLSALRALAFVRREAFGTCGSPDRLCVMQRGSVEVGASALTALAAAELLKSGDDPEVRTMLVGLTAFLRSQQRADGELMHEYDLVEKRPIDVQYMYYSGEAAMALLTAYEITRDARDLKTAQRLMGHLTGGAWSFFGSRYFYGEEHWTCQAVGKAAAHMDVTAAIDFCVRWSRWQGKLQYVEGQTPWAVEGAFGVGPVILPRVTTAASRVEASVPIYRVLADQKRAPDDMRVLIERSLGLLLRTRWAPGPDFLFRNPAAAVGGMAGTEADLRSRVDMVQHAGSAMLAWAKDGLFTPP